MQTEVTARLKELRNRAGMSMAEVAKACGMRGPSNYQYYEDEKLFRRPRITFELAEKLAVAFCGKGEPPIQESEVLALAGMKTNGARSLESSSALGDIVRLLQLLEAASPDMRRRAIAVLEALLKERQ